jgi:lactate dehydrogenase-like 2-hydroxyacid dehydrogenase
MRIGILGYGSIGSRHGRNLTALGHKIIIHDPSMADSLPKGVVIEKSDAVVIASPTSEHLNDMLLCCRHADKTWSIAYRGTW